MSDERRELAPVDAVGVWLSGLSPRTRVSYGKDIRHFGTWLGAETGEEACRRLISAGLHRSQATVRQYRAKMLDDGLAAATVNRRLSAIRSFLKLARMTGVIEWTLEVPGVRKEARRDMSGPKRDAVVKMFQAADCARTSAILRLLHDCGLRSHEVCELDVSHVDLSDGTLRIRSKGKRERVAVGLSAQAAAALKAWGEELGKHSGPLFPDANGDRITYRAIWRLVTETGERAGVGHVRPHGLRHTAITTVIQRTGGDLVTAQAFARHSDPRVTAGYVDDKAEKAQAATDLIAIQEEETCG